MLPAKFAQLFRAPAGGTKAIIAICIVVTPMAVFFMAQKVIDRERTAALQTHAARILERSANVADQMMLILRKARHLDTEPCSAKDLDQLRVLSFESRFVRDVVRLEQGAITCSAAWGRLDKPFALSAPHHRIDIFRFWRNAKTFPIGHVRSSVIAYGTVAVVAAPGVFDDASLVDPTIKTLLTSRDGTYVFRSFGSATETLPDQAHIPAPADAANAPEQYKVALCHATLSICVEQTSPRSFVWFKPWRVLAVLALLGILAGAGLGLVISGFLGRRNAMGAQLQRAIENDGIAVVYQPIRMLEDRRLVGVEALARWSDTKGKNIPPDQFIPLAEKLGLLDALTRSVLRSIFRELGDRLRSDPPFYVSVNVNSEAMINEQFRDYLHYLGLQHGILASRIALEVTERSSSDYADLKFAFKAIRDSGHMVMIDDFGTGYSNFAYLAALPLDAIKMDRAFTNAIGTESLASEVIPGIVSIAAGLNVTLIVEGIETEVQESYLKKLCPQARGQGWLLGRPTPAAGIPAC